ncbi:hypothetical protein DID73_01765, partial [Candidatus Marinamargulisbacteria bacterium SCGC AG-343-K17]
YAYDSRQINAGDCFICLPKGESYIEEALQKGATDVLHLSRQDFAQSANDYFDHPTKRVVLIGITGTNGKTSVTYFTEQLLKSQGHKVLVIGTINSSLTTPESWDVLSQIKDHADNGGTHVILEVSSHGIDQYRVYGFQFDVKCLTNITQDHLDYHKTFEHYKQTKLHFMNDYPGHSIYTDDVPLIDANDISQLSGSFHVKNVSSALAICKWIGEDVHRLSDMLPRLMAPKGRFETVNAGQPFTVIIDFAHTPDALEHVCRDALLQVSESKDRLKVVFGCGGDRDKTKREKMGMIAEKYSNDIYLTADNSRSESTLDIINEIKAGISSSSIKLISLNRQEAIAAAIEDAKPGDLILIAGKGHETMQHSNGFSYVFNDYDIAFSEIIRRQKFQVNQSWVLNQPDANADVLFISKKLMSLLKITYSQFKRAIPTPSNAKIKDYLSKIKGEKMIVFEGNDRCSVSELLIRTLRELGGGIEFVFDDQQTLEHNLVGLTLIEQTESPLVIRINPSDIGKIKKVVDVISPNHIIVGDIYNAQGFIEPSTVKSLMSLCDDESHQATIWAFNQMVDFVDGLTQENQNCQLVQSTSWMDYIQNLIESVLIKLDMYNELPRDIILRQLIATGWVTKVNFTDVKSPIYVLDWTEDVVDLNQKVAFFQQNSEAIVHHIITPSKPKALIDELLRNKYQSKAKVVGLDDQNQPLENPRPMKEELALHPDAIHVAWKLPQDALSILESMK